MSKENQNQNEVVQAFQGVANKVVDMELLAEKLMSEKREEAHELVEHFKPIEIFTLDDKKGYESVCIAHSKLVSFRTSTASYRKEQGDMAQKYSKALITQEKEILAITSDLEEFFKEQKSHYENLKKAEKEAQEKAEQAILDARGLELENHGLSFDGNFYSLGSISLDIATIKSLSDNDYSTLLDRIISESERINSEDKEAMIRVFEDFGFSKTQDKEGIKFSFEKYSFSAEYEAILRGEELSNAILYFSKLKNKIDEEEKKREIEALNDEREENRAEILIGLGFEKKGSNYEFSNSVGHTIILVSDVRNLSASDFKEILSDRKEKISELKNKEVEMLEAQKLESEKKEKEAKEAAEAKAKKEAEEKQKKVEKEAKEKAEAEAKRLAELPDAEKFKKFSEDIKAILGNAPEMSTETYKQNLNVVISRIENALK